VPESPRWLVTKGRTAAARSVLESVHADRGTDVRLMFDLGFVLSRAHDDARTVEVLARALALWPDHPMAISAYFDLAIAYARLGQREAEIAAYGQYLRQETDPVGRAQALSNRAESESALGHSAASILDFRAAIDLAPDDPLIYWYEALGAMVRAKAMDDPATALLAWETGVAKWSAYLAAAPLGDRFVSIATARRAACARELELARRRAKRRR